MKKIISIAIASGLLMSSAFTFAAEEEVTAAPASQIELTTINPANPAFIMTLMNPATHQSVHGVVRNPANWAQFMSPQFFMQMANPANAVAWMNPSVYQSMMNPEYLMHWMQPTTVMNELSSVPFAAMANPATYMTFMNPAIAQQWMDPANYSAAMGQMNPAASTQNMFDMNSWFNMFQPVVPKVEENNKQG